MSAQQDVRTDRHRMSWEDYLALDDSSPGEYLDGYLIMTPPPDDQHQLAARRLANALEMAIPKGYRVGTAVGWTPARGHAFIPDVLVYPAPADPQAPIVTFTGVPVLAVEVLSQNRVHDLVVKMAEYASFGLPRYWIVDRDQARLDAYVLDGDRYLPVLPSVGTEPVEISLGIATVTLRIGDLLEY